MTRFLFALGFIGLTVSLNANAGISTGSRTVDEFPGQPNCCHLSGIGNSGFGQSEWESFADLKGAVKSVAWAYLEHGQPRKVIYEFNTKGRITKVTEVIDGKTVGVSDKFEYDNNNRMTSSEGKKYHYFVSENRNIAIEAEYAKAWVVSKGYINIVNADGDSEYYLITVSPFTASGEKYVLSKDKMTWKQVSGVGSDIDIRTGKELVAKNENEAQNRIVKLLDCLQQNTCGKSGERHFAGDEGVPILRAFGVIKSKDGDFDKFTTYFGEMWFKNGHVQESDNLATQAKMVGGGHARREHAKYQYEYDDIGNWTKREIFKNSVKLNNDILDISDNDTETRKIEYYK
jgi:hypothetical protein